MPCTFSVQNSLGQRRMIHRCSQRSVTAAKRTFLADEREGKRIRNDLHLLTRNINLWEGKAEKQAKDLAMWHFLANFVEVTIHAN